jgi:hypothetical protein
MRRFAEELKRQGWQVNYKRVLRLMRLDNLLCLRKRRFIATTDSAHALPVYPNLARDLHFDGPNQLWVADITYIWLRNEFIYLAVALAVKACQAGQTIFFTTMADLIEKLKADHEAKKTGRGTATACAASLPRKRRQRLSGYPKALLGP